MSWETTVEAVASGVGASIGVAAVARRWFRSAVQDVVKDEIEPVVERQRQVMNHLDRQDRRLERIEQKLNNRR